MKAVLCKAFGPAAGMSIPSLIGGWNGHVVNLRSRGVYCIYGPATGIFTIANPIWQAVRLPGFGHQWPQVEPFRGERKLAGLRSQIATLKLQALDCQRKMTSPRHR